MLRAGESSPAAAVEVPSGLMHQLAQDIKQA